MPAQFINRVAGLERSGKCQPFLCFLPFLVIVYSRPPSQAFILYCCSDNMDHLQGFIYWRRLQDFYLVFTYRIESVNITWHSLNGIFYFNLRLPFKCGNIKLQKRCSRILSQTVNNVRLHSPCNRKVHNNLSQKSPPFYQIAGDFSICICYTLLSVR